MVREDPPWTQRWDAYPRPAVNAFLHRNAWALASGKVCTPRLTQYVSRADYWDFICIRSIARLTEEEPTATGYALDS